MWEKFVNVFLYPKDGDDYVTRNRLLYYILLFCLLFKLISIILPNIINPLTKLICDIQGLEKYILFLHSIESILIICFVVSFITSSISAICGFADIVIDQIFHRLKEPSVKLGNIHIKIYEIFLNLKYITSVFIKIMFSSTVLLWIFDAGAFMRYFNHIIILYNDSNIILTFFFIIYAVYIISSLIDFVLFLKSVMSSQPKIEEKNEGSAIEKNSNSQVN